MTYAQLIQYLVTLLQTEDTYGVEALNAIIAYLIQRGEDIIFQDAELDFLFSRQADVSQSTATGSRAVPIAPEFITVEGVSIIIPANTKPPGTQQSPTTRIPYLRTTRPVIDLIWPNEQITAPPDPLNGGYYAIFDFEESSPAEGNAEAALPSSFLIAPTPDNTYVAEVTGTYRPAVISATNTPTYLSTYYPTLLITAILIAAAQWQRDAQLQAVWDAEYQKLKMVAVMQSRRQKSTMAGFSATAQNMPTQMMPPMPMGPRVPIAGPAPMPAG